MFNIQLMNKIAKVGTDVFDKTQFAIGVGNLLADLVAVVQLVETDLCNFI